MSGPAGSSPSKPAHRVNYFSFSGFDFLGSRLYTVDKSALYDATFGAGSDLFLYNPQASFVGTGATMQPAQPHTDPGGSIGTWVSSFGGFTNGSSEFLLVIRVDDPLAGGGASFDGGFVNVGDICPNGNGASCGTYTAAPQPGASTTFQTNDPRALDAEWRSDGLWITATINSNEAVGQATAHWWRVDTNTLAVQQGDLGGEDIGPDTYTFFPSVSVNDGCAVVGYAAASGSLFAGSYYSAIELVGYTAGPAQTAKAGEGTYSAFDGSPYRWGDYASTEVDFTSPGDNDFWTFNEYALAGNNQWGTWFAKDDCLGAIPVELMGFDAAATGADVALAWQTASETANAGFDVERRAEGGVFERLAFVEGAGTTAEAQAYRFRDASLPAGRYTYRLRQIDLDGTTAYSPEVEVFVGVPGAYALGDASPNPATGSVRFTLAVQRAQTVTVAVYDALGRQVAEVFEGPVEAQRAVEMSFDASGLPSGLYVYRAVGETFTAAKPVTVIR